MEDLAQRLLELALEPEFRARYRVDRALGRGAMGVVFSAEQVATGRPVAVKFMLALDDEVALERLEREGRLLARVAHPGLTRVIDAGSVSGYPYLVTELMTGGTLSEKIRAAGRLKSEEALAIARELLPALAACHEAGVVHRDLKPANVLFDGEGKAWLADLGVARWRDEHARLTATGAVIGTPLYVAPELFGGGAATAAADLYSFGCMFFEMLSGDPPFRSPALRDLLRMHLFETPPRLDAAVAGASPALADVLDHALEKKPEDRPTSAAALLAELEAALSAGASSPAVAPRPATPDGASEAPRRKRPTARSAVVASERPGPLRIAIAGALLGLFGGAGFYLARTLGGRPMGPESPTVSAPKTPSPSGFDSGSDAPSPSASSVRIAPVGDGGAPLPAGAIALLGLRFGSHPSLHYLDATRNLRWVVSASRNAVRVWSVPTRRMTGTWRARETHIIGVAARDDGSAVIALEDDGMLRFRAKITSPPANAPPLDLVIFEPATGRDQIVVGPSYTSAWAVAPGGRHAVWHDAASGQLSVAPLAPDRRPTARGSGPRPLAVALSADGARAALLFADALELRDPGAAPRRIALDEKRLAGSARCAPGVATALALSPDGRRVAVVGDAGAAVFDAATGRRLAQDAYATALAGFSADSTELLLATGSEIAFSDATTLRVRTRGTPSRPLASTLSGLVTRGGSGFALPGDEGPRGGRVVEGLDPEARFAVLARSDGTFSAWHRKTGLTTELPGPRGMSFEAVARDGRTVYLRERRPDEEHDRIHAADAHTATTAPAVPIPRGATFVPLGGPGHHLIVHPDLTLDVTERTGRIRRLNSARAEEKSAKPVRPIGLPDRAGRRVLLSHPERGLIAVDLAADEVRTIWRLPLVTMMGVPRTASLLDASRQVALASADGLLHLEPLGAGSSLALLKGRDAVGALALATSPDSRWIVAGLTDGSVIRWNRKTGAASEVAPRGHLEVRSIGLDASDDVVLTLDDDGVMIAWDVRTARPLEPRK